MLFIGLIPTWSLAAYLSRNLIVDGLIPSLQIKVFDATNKMIKLYWLMQLAKKFRCLIGVR